MSDETPIKQVLAIHPYDRISDIGGFVITMGQAIFKSGFFKCVNVEQGQVIALDCLVRKVTPLERAQTDHIVDGKLSMRSDAMLAKFIERGGKVKWLNQGDDGIEAKAKFTTSDGANIEIKYSMDDAKRTGCVKPGSGYAKDPGAQLRARLISKAVRMLDPMAVAGRYTPEELGEEADFSSSVPVANEEKHKPVNLPSSNPAMVGKADTVVVEKVDAPVAATPPAETVAETPAQAPTISTTGTRGSITDEQKYRIGAAKKTLKIEQDKWLAICRKRGYESAKDMSAEDAQKLMLDLEKKVADREMNAFADRVLSGAPVPEKAEVKAEEPPFDVT